MQEYFPQRLVIFFFNDHGLNHPNRIDQSVGDTKEKGFRHLKHRKGCQGLPSSRYRR